MTRISFAWLCVSNLSLVLASLELASCFADHSWITEHTQQPEVSCGQCHEVSFTPGDLGNSSFSTPLVSASRDVSFSTSSLIPCQRVEDHSLPAFTCRSSCSSFIVDVPFSSTISFSFQNGCESDGMRFCSQMPVVPSFAFFMPEQQKPFSFTSEELNIKASQTGNYCFSLLFMSSVLFKMINFHSFCCVMCRLKLEEALCVTLLGCML